MGTVLILVIGLVIGLAFWSTMGGRGAPTDDENLGPANPGTPGDEEATGGLSHRLQASARAESTPLRQRAVSDRSAAVKYRDELLQKLKALEPRGSQPSSSGLDEAEQREARERNALERAEVSRELEWVEARLRSLSK